MRLAKERIDAGVFTNRTAEMLRFWQETVGLPFEELLPLGGGARQHRHGLNGSVFKLNEVRDPLPSAPPSGYKELLIGRAGLDSPVHLTDPEGVAVTLVPAGHLGVVGLGVRLGVSDEAAFHRFYGESLELDPAGERAYRCGDSVIFFEQGPGHGANSEMRAPGFRYLTIQVWDVDAEHAGLIARGAREGRPPVTLGTTARISFIRDPDGNWIEISQRASLTGALPA